MYMSIWTAANLSDFFWFHISRKAAQKINANEEVEERFKVSNKTKDTNLFSSVRYWDPELIF